MTDRVKPPPTCTAVLRSWLNPLVPVSDGALDQAIPAFVAPAQFVLSAAPIELDAAGATDDVDVVVAAALILADGFLRQFLRSAQWARFKLAHCSHFFCQWPRPHVCGFHQVDSDIQRSTTFDQPYLSVEPHFQQGWLELKAFAQLAVGAQS